MADNQLLDNGDDLWINFSSFLEKIFLFCNQDQDLLSGFSSINPQNLIEECLKNTILVRSIEQFTSLIFKELNAHSKDDLDAEKLRKDGNDLFKEKMYSDALETYSAAILKAKQQFDDDNNTGNRNEACLNFANRSAAFFNLKKFEYAFEDAKRALKLGHYDKDKLNNRIQKCKSFMQRDECATSDQCFTNDKINLDYEKQKGRLLIANKSIEMGECLIKEQAFVSIVNSDYYLAFCNHCLSQLNGYGVPCLNCSYAIFCSEKCLSESTSSCHRDECGKISDLINQLGVGYLVLRLGFKVGFENMIYSFDELENKLNNKLSSNYEDVYNLMTHANEFELKENLSFALISLFFKQLLENYSRFTFTREDESIKLCKLFLRHIQQLSTNLISIDQEVALDAYDNCGIEMNEKLKVGIGFYPIVSLLNHSCIPNVMPKFKGNHLEVTAIKLIEKGTGNSHNF